MQLADGVEFTEGEFLPLESDRSPDKTACTDCHCVFVDANAELRFAKCTEKRPVLCEYKGQSCPHGMTQIYGKCIGVARNTQADEANDTNCNWQSNHPNFRLAELMDDEV